jgi:hypothetical protein
LALLGSAGSAAATVVADWVSWVSPVLIGLSVLLLGRSFWIVYVQKRGSRAVKVITWASATFVVCFWTWWLFFPHPTPESMK